MGNEERWQRFAPLPENIVDALPGLVSLFQREGVIIAYLFGSFARGERGKDIDLAILLRDKPAYYLREKINRFLETERVDLVDLRDAPPVLLFEIIRTGKPVYYVSDDELERFELRAINLYRDTAPMRRLQNNYLRERVRQWSSEEK